jgi:RNA polymerase sigma factor (sigma-70 family)
VAGAEWGEIGLSDECERDSREELIALVGQHEVSLYRYLVAFTGDREVALDCVQDTFTRAYEQLRRGKSVNIQWLYTVGRNRGIDEMRRRKREGADRDALERMEGAPIPEDMVSLQHAFGNLSPDDRAILSLAAIEGLSGEEAAARLGIRPGAVRMRLFRARERFRQAMRLLGPALLVLLVLALVSRAGSLFLVLWFLLALYALSRLWSWRISRQVRLTRRCKDRTFAGTDLTVTLEVENTGRLPVPYLEVRDQVPARLTTADPPQYVFSLGGRQQARIIYAIACRNRGYYTLGPIRAQTGDPLSLNRRDLPPAAEHQLIVYPRIVPLRRLGLPTRSALVAIPAPASLLKDPSRIAAIRPYQPGDPPRALHWGATARMGQLMVKQYQPAISRATLLCLDLHRDAYPIQDRRSMEQGIVVAASLANHIVTRERLPVGLVAAGSGPLAPKSGRITLGPQHGRKHLMAMLEVLAGIEPGGAAAFVPLLRQECVRWSAGTTVVVITGSLRVELVDVLLFLIQRGHAVAVILVRPRVVRVDEPSISARFPVHRVWDDEDLAA